MQSDKIGELAKALAAAQKEIKAPTKGKKATIPGKDGRPGYSYAYADLSDVIDSYREPLAKHGLALMQTTRLQDGHIVLVTKLLHESDQWVDSEYPITSFARPQEQGSAITYARRYAVSALLGIAAEDDDDGERAQNGKPVETKAAPKPAPSQALANGAQERIFAAAKRAGLKTPAELAPVLHEILGVSKASEVPEAEVSNVIEALDGMARKVPA